PRGAEFEAGGVAAGVVRRGRAQAPVTRAPERARGPAQALRRVRPLQRALGRVRGRRHRRAGDQQAGGGRRSGPATRSIAGSMAARFALGMAGAAAGGLLGGLVAAWFARGIILDFADDDAERAMLLRFSRRYMLFSLVMVALIVATHLAFHDP